MKNVRWMSLARLSLKRVVKVALSAVRVWSTFMTKTHVWKKKVVAFSRMGPTKQALHWHIFWLIVTSVIEVPRKYYWNSSYIVKKGIKNFLIRLLFYGLCWNDSTFNLNECVFLFFFLNIFITVWLNCFWYFTAGIVFRKAQISKQFFYSYF